MDNSINILTPLNIPSQLPLDRKAWVKNEAELLDLGTNNEKTYYYHKGLKVTSVEELTTWEWREPENPDEIGLLPSNYVYPDYGVPIVVFGQDYQGRSFNFFPVKNGVFQNDIQVSLSNNKTLGKYTNGQIIPATGKTFEEVLADIAQEVINPTFINPTFSLSHNQTSGSSVREVGQTLNVVLTANANRGSIMGKLVSGVWNPSSEQDKRSGAVIWYKINGVEQTSNTLTVSNHVITPGANVFNGSVLLGIGPQPKNSIGGNYGTPYPETELSASTTITGEYKIFYGNYNGTLNIRSLPQNTFNNIAISNTLDLATGNTNKYFAICVPVGKILDSVLAVEASNADITSQYVHQGIMTVADAGSGTKDYNVYIMETDIPYSTAQTHRFKFKLG